MSMRRRFKVWRMKRLFAKASRIMTKIAKLLGMSEEDISSQYTDRLNMRLQPGPWTEEERKFH